MSKEPTERLRESLERILTGIEKQLDEGKLNQTVVKALTESRKCIELLVSQDKLTDDTKWSKDEIYDMFISALIDAEVPDEYLERIQEECKRRGL